MEWYLMTFIIGLIWGSSVAAELSGNAVEPGLYTVEYVQRLFVRIMLHSK